MEMENQVCTLIQSEKLVELGIITKSLFEYCKKIGRDMYIREVPFIDTADMKEIQSPAFTVSELLTMLPTNTSLTKGGKKYPCRYWWGKLSDGVLRESKSSNYHTVSLENAAHTCADMLIFLLENKLTTIEQVNQSFNN